MKIKLLFTLMALYLFSSCDLIEKESSSNATVNIKDNNIPSVSHQGGDATIRFSTEGDWYVGLEENDISGDIVTPQWCRIKGNQSGDSGENLQITIEVDAQYKNNYHTRYARVVFKSDNSDKIEVSITQDGFPSILADPEQDAYKSFNHYENGFNVDVKIQINDITITIKEGQNPMPDDDIEVTWIKVGEPNLPPETSKKEVTSKALSPNTSSLNTPPMPTYESLGFIVEQNNTPYERFATITLTYGDITSEIGVNQYSSDHEITFINEEFEKFVISHYDRNYDGKLSDVEAALVTHMDCSNIPLGTMQGIEHFINLTNLTCRNSSIGYIDLSNNTKLIELDCSENHITELIVTNNIDLKTLICSNNLIYDIDITNNTKLEEFDCNDNIIKKFDLTKNTKLKTFNCSTQEEYEGALTSLDLSKNIELTSLSCSATELFSLDVSQNINLVLLHCNRTNMTELDLSRNINLAHLAISNIKSIDLSHNKNLKSFYASNLNSLDLSNNKELTDLDLSLYGELKHLDLSNNNNIKTVKLNNYYLTTIDLTGASELETLNIVYNPSTWDQRGLLSKLDVSDSPKLTQLWCQYQSIKELNILNKPVLTNIQCHSNYIRELNLSECPKLEELYCWGNSLTTLDLSNNRSLTDLNCAKNKLKELDVSRTNMSNSTSTKPLDCSKNSNLTTLYLKKDWKINAINVGRNDNYIPTQTEIKYKK